MALRLDELNPPQRRAVTHRDGPLLVLAGAGSGKTRVITYRVAWLLEQGVPAESILAVSFTNKAANEMRERVIHLVGQKAADKVTMCTFHALGLMILKAEREALGFPTGFTIYDQADQLGVVRECLRQVQLDDRRFDPKAILHRISLAKNKFIAPGELEIRGVLETQQGTGTFVGDRKPEGAALERQRQLTQLVSEFVARAGASGFLLEELVAELQELASDRGKPERGKKGR